MILEDEFIRWLKTPHGTIILNRDFGHLLHKKIDSYSKITPPEIIAEFERFCSYKGLQILSIEGKNGIYKAKVRGREREKTISVNIKI